MRKSVGRSHRQRNPLIFFAETLCFLGFATVLYTIFIPGTLPPAGLDSSQFFYFLTASAILSIAAVSAVAATMTNGSSQHFRFHRADGIVTAFALYFLGNAWVHGATGVTGRWEIALLFALYLNTRLYVSLDKKRALASILFLLLVAGLVQEIVGFRQLYGYGYSNHARFRITGTFHNPAPLGGYLAIVTGLALHQALALYRTVSRRFGILGLRSLLTAKVWTFLLSCLFLIGAFMLLPATQSRIAWLGTLAGVATVLFPYAKQPVVRWVRTHKRAAVSIGLAGIVAAGICLVGVYRMKAESANGRLLMWKTTASMIADYPLLGVGAGNFAGIYGDYQAAYFASGCASESEIHVAGSSGAAFNDYLQCTAEFGIIGLALFLAVNIQALSGYWRAGRTGFAAALIALLVFALASYPFQLLSFRIIWVLLAVGGIASFNGDSVRRQRKWQGKWQGIAVWCAASVITGTALIQVSAMRGAYERWGQLTPMYRMENFESVKDEYAALAPDLTSELQFLFEYANVLSKTGEPEASNKLLLRSVRVSSDPMLYNLLGNNYKALKEYPAAEQAYLRAYHAIPSRMYPLYLLMQLYETSGEEEKRNAMARRVVVFDEKVDSPAVREMKAEASKILQREESEPK